MTTVDRTPGLPADEPPGSGEGPGGAPAAPAAPAKPGLREALVAFRYRNFALFWSGALLSNTGSQIQAVTIPYVVFKLTGNAALVGLTTFLQFVPIVLIGPLGGSLADRYDRRSVLMATQSAQAVAALLLWLAWVTDHHSIGVFVTLVALSGLVAGLNIASWQAFVSELVPREVLLNAVTLNSTQFNAARAFGPALGGVVLALLGVSWAFMFNAVSFLAVIVALVLIKVPKLPKVGAGEAAHVWQQFRTSVRYARTKPGIMACFVVVAALGGLGSPMVQLFTVFAQDVYQVGDLAYGVLAASLGIGAIIAAPFIAGRGSGMRRSRLIEISTLVYGAAIVVFALAPVYGVGVLALAVAGGGYLAIASTLNTTIQLQVDETMRGKVLAVYVMLLTAALPVGALVQGLLARVLGPQPAVAIFGVAFLLVVSWLRWRTDLLPHTDDVLTPAGATGANGSVAPTELVDDDPWDEV